MSLKKGILGVEQENKEKPKKGLLSPYLLETAFKTPFRSSSAERQEQKTWNKKKKKRLGTKDFSNDFFLLPDVLLLPKEILTQLPYEARLPYPTYDHMAQSTQGKTKLFSTKVP